MDSARKRRSSVISRATSRVTDLEDDAKSTTSTFHVRPEPGVLVRVIELCAESLVDRFLEFEAFTVLIRGIDASDQPGAIIGAISSVTSNVDQVAHSETSPRIEAVFYSDTSFFHIFEGDVTLLICTPALPGKRFVADLHRLFESSLKTHCISSPLMFATVKCSYRCQLALNTHLASRCGAESSLACAAVPKMLQRVTNVNRSHNKRAAGAADPASSGSVTSTMMNDFCLLFHQSASEATLLSALSRMHHAVESCEVPTRIGPMLTSFLQAIPPLFEVLWMSSDKPDVSKEVSDILITIICRLSESSVRFLFAQHGSSECVSILIAMLRNPTFGSQWAPSVHVCLASMFCLVSPIECTKELRHNANSAVSDFLHTTQTLTASLVEAFQSTLLDVNQSLPSPGASSVALRRLFEFSQKLDATATNAGKVELARAMHPNSALLSKSRSYNIFRVLWGALANALTFASATLDDCAAAIAHSPIGTQHQHMQAVVLQLTSVVALALRSSLRLLPDDLCSVLEHASPALNTYFRRIVSWGEFMQVSPLWHVVMSQASAYMFVVGLSREITPNHVSFVTHSWLARISNATGPKAATAFFSELHRLFRSFSETFPSWENRQSIWHHRIQGVMASISAICDHIIKSSPSPSLALTCWEACETIVGKFSAIVDQPLALLPRIELARLLIQDGGELLADEIGDVFSYQIPVIEECELLWDDYTSLRDVHARKGFSLSSSVLESRRFAESTDIGIFEAVLQYLLPSLESEASARRWNSLAAQLFEISHFLVGVGAPHSIVAAFVESGVLLSQRHEGISETSLTSISDRFCSECFGRLNLSSAWSLASSLRNDRLASDSDFVSASRVSLDGGIKARNQAPAVRQSVVAPELIEETVSVVTRRRKYESNLLHKIVVAYKNL